MDYKDVDGAFFRKKKRFVPQITTAKKQIKLITIGSGIASVEPKLSIKIDPSPPTSFVPKNKPISSGAIMTFSNELLPPLAHLVKVAVFSTCVVQFE